MSLCYQEVSEKYSKAQAHTHSEINILVHKMIKKCMN